ncbi:MAG: hypothetical protein ABF545_05945 [Bifidobacterium psychraerophilum]|uniref:hypothetical protein n=1 Tax=Bifidobacterium psychraerophilum TaxID=218140 RepID=UPI0039E8892B
MIAPRPAKPLPHHKWRCAVALLLIVLMEAVAFNLPHWSSLHYLGEQASSNASVTIGDGLKRERNGLLSVVEPSKAYIQMSGVDARVGFIHISTNDAAADSGSSTSLAEITTTPDNSTDVRLDALSSTGNGEEAWTAGSNSSVSTDVPMSAYLRNPDAGGRTDSLRLWIQEPTGTVVRVDGFSVNPRVPWHFDALRIAAMCLIALLVLAFLPHSWLWRTRLDTGDGKQRLLLSSLLIPFILVAVTTIISVIVWPQQQIFHNDNGYTYDFNQYGHVADALLHGRPWLDLKVPDQLLLSKDPLDIATRQSLLDHGTQPIYWDYVLYEGHWYSYFGVLPAVALFLPYQAITSLWVDGGLMLPAQAASMLLLLAASVMLLLLVIRIINRHFTAVPLAVVVIGAIVCFTGSNLGYLWNTGTFYTIPLAASLALSALGLWLWLGARQVRDSHDAAWRMWRCTDMRADKRGEIESRLSLPRIALGSLCLGANLACRPAFVLTCLLALPIFWDELVALIGQARKRPVKQGGLGEVDGQAQDARRRTVARRSLLKAFAAATLPAAAAMMPALAYNYWRFGSFLNFGNQYQVTVVNLRQYQTPIDNIPYIVGYYLGQPLSFTRLFPWISYAPAPLPHWQYTESGVGGLLMLCPALIVIAALPLVRRFLRSRRVFGIAWSLLLLGLVMAVFDAYLGGFVWRYMADFGWLLSLCAVIVIAAIAERSGAPNPSTHAMAANLQADTRPDWAGRSRGLAMGAITVLALAGLAITLLAGAAITAKNNPDALVNIHTWFAAF